MNPNQSRTLWISVGLGVLAMFLVYSYSQEKKAMYDREFGVKKNVVVAKVDIQDMAYIDETMVEYVEMPAKFIQPGTFEDISEAVNRVAAVPFKKGEPIIDNKTNTLGPNTGLARQIAPQKRAVSIPIDEVRGVSKLIIPGDHIDILASIETGSGPTKKTQVKTLMQDVVVLATGERITNNIPRVLEKENFSDKAMVKKLAGDTTFTSITVEASPQEAQNLVYILASSPGSLYMSLRNPNDRLTTNLAPSSSNSILGFMSEPILNRVMPPVAPAPVPAAPPSPRKPASKRGPFIEIK